MRNLIIAALVIAGGVASSGIARADDCRGCPSPPPQQQSCDPINPRDTCAPVPPSQGTINPR